MMGAAAISICRISALVLCAGAGVALTGATGGTFVATMAGSATGGAAGNFFHQIVDGVLSWLGGTQPGPTTLPDNHDLDALTASAVKLVFECARDRLSKDDPKRGVLERLAKAPLDAIVAAMQAQEGRVAGDVEVVNTLGTAAGGQTTTVATPEYWQAFVTELMGSTRAAEQPGALKTPIRGVPHLFTLAARAVKEATKDLLAKDITAHGKDPSAEDAAVFAAGLLHLHIAAFGNDVLRDTFGPQGRFFVAALFNYLNTIAAAVQRPPTGVTLTKEQGEQIKAWIDRAVRGALAAGKSLPAPHTDEEKAAATQLMVQTDALTETLRSMGADVAFIRAGMARWSDTLAPELVLPPRVTDTTRDRFVYRTRRLAVVGRDDELRELNAWLDMNAPFGWDLWVGPAGSGKSRLALELCDRRDDWDAGFFRFDGPHTPNWKDWDPKANTLVIFDYVAEDAQRIGQLVDLFARRAAGTKARLLPPGVKLRFLLLERAAVRDDAPASVEPEPHVPTRPGREGLAPPSQKLEAPWLGVLRSAAKQNGADVEAVYGRGDLNHPGRYLGGMSVTSAAEVICAEHAGAQDLSGSPLPQIKLQELQKRFAAAHRIDPHLRPLFVAMAAEAVREKSGAFDSLDGGTGIDALVQYINDKEWEHAGGRLRAFTDGPGAAMDAWAKFVCLATMCNGLADPPEPPNAAVGSNTRKTLTEALGMAERLNTPDAEVYGGGARYALLVSGASEREAPKLEPDVLGEGFVLWWLAAHPRLARPLIDAAWKLGMADFVRRAAENFPARTEVSGLLNPTQGADPAALAAAHLALGVLERDRGNFAALRARGHHLLTQAGSDGVTPLHPPRVRALGAFMWMQGTPTPVELQEFTAIVDALLAAGPPDAATRAELAMGLTNALADVGPDHALADALLARLQAMADDHPADAAVRKELAKGLTNAIADAPADRTRTDFLLDRLRALANAHPAETAVREQLASGLTNAIAHEDADYARSDALLDSLRALANDHRSDTSVRDRLAKGIFNAFQNASANNTRADALLDSLRALADDHHADAAVREQLAKALFNAFNIAPVNNTHANALFDRLQELADAHQADAATNTQAWKACVAAFLRSLAPGPPEPRHLVALAAVLPRLSGDGKVRSQTLTLIDYVVALIPICPEPIKTELDTACGQLRRSLQAAFAIPPSPGPTDS